jgi:hypothetical protein
MLRRLGRMFARVSAGIRFLLGKRGEGPWTTLLPLRRLVNFNLKENGHTCLIT